MASTFEGNISNSESEEEEPQTSAPTEDLTIGGKISDNQVNRRKRLQDRIQGLKRLKNKARKLNREAVKEEDRVSKLPENHESRQISAQWKLDELEAKAKAKADGDDYNLVKLRDIQADHAEVRHHKKQARKDPDKGFSSWADCTSRQYRKLAKEMEPDWRAYNTERERLGHDDFYATMNTQIDHQRRDNPNAKNRLAEAITQQQEKRAKYHRRRTYNEDDHINYINERNRKFNAKAERAYGQFTGEIRDNLERGTAL